MVGQVKVLDLEGKETEMLELPSVFRVPVREDVINKAYVALDSRRRQPQGRDPLAGERTTAETNNPPTGRGISRIPRVKGERYSKSGMAGGVASTVHGRLPHPPRSEKVIQKGINSKERLLALASAIAATGKPEFVSKRGHRCTSDLPIVVSNDVEKITKVRDLKKLLSQLGLGPEMERVRARNRKRAAPNGHSGARIGPLFVVSNGSSLKTATRSVEGVSVVKSSDLSILDLAPGSSPGRLTIWSKDSLGALTKNVLGVGDRFEA
jgi:large subunit ribosomal protein L4e